jgi:hypothetical protein
VGNTLLVVVHASNAAGASTASSSPTAPVGRPPANGSPPAISGTAQDGQTLTASNGDWTGTAPLSYAYQWQDCDPSGNNCQDIPGAMDSSYDISSNDVGSTIVVQVTASNAVGETTVSSSPTSAVTAVAPANTTAPEISGTPQDGQTLIETADQWSGTTPTSYAYQWQLCDASGSNCHDIPDATDGSYTPDSSDIGSTLVVVVTVSNDAGTATASSNPSSVITAAPPANTVAPTVTGTVEDAQTLTADNGAWSGTAPLSYTYQWEQCDWSGTNCQSIPGATEQTYTANSNDVGYTLVVQVSATNSAGSAAASSAATPTVALAPPVNVSPPVVSGNLQDGQTLSAGLGDWSGTEPTPIGYQWERCDGAGQNCQPIVNATGSTYQLTSADVGNTVAVQVVMWNWAGSAEASSDPTATIAPLAPANTVTPSISGTPQSGLTLRGVGSEWSGTTPLSYSYQWLSCDASGGSCSPVAGATDATYTPGGSDVGTKVEVTVTVTNAGGTASATSPPSTAVAQAAPSTVTISYGYDANGRLTSVSGR